MLVLTNLREVNPHKLIIKSSIIFSFYLFIIIQDGENNILFYFSFQHFICSQLHPIQVDLLIPIVVKF
jgi:hypothetical protein